MNKLSQKFGAHWRTVFAALEGKTVLLAVSGGVDSMAMAYLFRDNGVPFAVAHCNFGLRGAAADLDEALVHDWCHDNSIPFHAVKFSTKERAEEWKKGTQETARILRYDWFASLQQEHGYARVATAHHANDNAETLLINLFRGTGIQGLHGILPDNGSVIRPLLFMSRAEITDYAQAAGIAWRDDESNESDDYLRNAIRHNVIPEVQKLFPGIIGNLNESIGRFAEAEQLYNKSIEAERKGLMERRGNDYYIPVRKLRHRQPLSTICYELLQPFGFSPAQVPQVVGLILAESGRYVASATHRIIRNRDFLVVTTLAAEGADIIQIEEGNCTVSTDRHSYSFTMVAQPDTIPTDVNEACISLDALSFPLALRRWRIGDYFYPLGMGMKKKKVSRLLIDQKVPLHEKEHIWVLECNKRIVWVCGIRLDERFKVKPATTQMLRISRQPTF